MQKGAKNKNEKIIIAVTFTLYLCVMLFIGFYFYKRTKNVSDYALGGRKLGKWGTSISAQAVEPALLNPFDIGFITGSDKGTVGMAVIGIVSSLAWGLGYFGQPHIITRFMAIEDPEEIKASRRIATIWVLITLAASTAVGLVGHFYFPDLKGSDAETIFILLVHKCVPLCLIGILLSAILAAIMSTADSQLLVTSSTVSEDIYKSMINPDATDKQVINVSRFTVLAVAVIAFFISLNPDSSVLKLVSYAWAGFGCAFGPVILLSLFWKGMTRNGAIAGMAAGGLTSAIWPVLKTHFTAPIFSLYEIVPGFIVALAAIYIFSKLEKKKSL